MMTAFFFFSRTSHVQIFQHVRLVARVLKYSWKGLLVFLMFGIHEYELVYSANVPRSPQLTLWCLLTLLALWIGSFLIIIHILSESFAYLMTAKNVGVTGHILKSAVSMTAKVSPLISRPGLQSIVKRIILNTKFKGKLTSNNFSLKKYPFFWKCKFFKKRINLKGKKTLENMHTVAAIKLY